MEYTRCQPGSATKAAIALAGLNAARDLYLVSPAHAKFRLLPYVNPEQVN
jgi:hypothetical protein